MFRRTFFTAQPCLPARQGSLCPTYKKTSSPMRPTPTQSEYASPLGIFGIVGSPLACDRCTNGRTCRGETVFSPWTHRGRLHGIALQTVRTFYCDFLLSMNACMKSMGIGKMVVELFSDATSTKVCKYRICNAIG